MYFVIYKNSNNYQQPYWWVIKSEGNHATLATSEMYGRKSDCVSIIQKIAREVGSSKYYDQTGE